MNAEHTPGPWHCEYAADDYFSVTIPGAGQLSRNRKTNQANAALIAAAPELLMEYQKLLARLKDASESCLNGGSQVAEELCHEFAEFESHAIRLATPQ